MEFLTEKTRHRFPFGSSFVDIGACFSIRGLMSNPISSLQCWKPSNFGGEAGFSIVKEITLEKRFCKNIEGECPCQLPCTCKHVTVMPRHMINCSETHAFELELDSYGTLV